MLVLQFFFVWGNEAQQIMFFLSVHSCTPPYQANLSRNMKASLPTRPAHNTFMGWRAKKNVWHVHFKFLSKKIVIG